jgi:hypothetical protein
MPIEIRELSIKTEVNTNNEKQQTEIKEKDLNQLKEQLHNECEKMIAEQTKGRKSAR